FAPLPVELMSFSSVCLDNDVAIKWTTASENNSMHFVVETSTDGVNWEVLSVVPAAQFSTSILNYAITHEGAARNKNYYRLIQVDLDGAVEFFNVIYANCGDVAGEPVVFPNPSNGNFTIDFSGAEMKGVVQLSIMNAEGKEISNREFNLEEGVNTYQINFYSGYNFNKYFFDSLAGIAWNQYNSNRSIVAVDANATAKFNGQTYIAKAKTGFAQKLKYGFNLGPEVSMSFVRTDIQDYSEKGADGLNLNVKNISADFLESLRPLLCRSNVMVQKVARPTHGPAKPGRPQGMAHEVSTANLLRQAQYQACQECTDQPQARAWGAAVP
ncbi:MAG: hypothetical protein RIS02_962, partial [Pseudomonadota bacterium]